MTTSKWNDEFVREHAPGLRAGRNKGVRAAVRLAKRIDAGLRDESTPPERRRRYREAQ